MDAATKVALGLGAFGSLLGLLNLALKAIELWRDRSNIVLAISQAPDPVIGYGKHTLDLTKNVRITVTNRGRRPARVESAGLLHRDGSGQALMQNSLGQQAFPAVLDERNPWVDVSAKADDLREKYSTAGQTPPTHMFCWTADKRHTRRLSRKWVRFLTSSPIGAGPSAGAGPGGAVEDGAAKGELTTDEERISG